MKQTAVNWLIENSHVIPKTGLNKRELINQAKEMEKEQHKETFKQSRLAKIFEKDMPPVWDSWEKYYENF